MIFMFCFVVQIARVIIFMFCFVFAEQIFNMKFTAKQLNKLSQKQEKESLQVKLGA